MLWDITMKSIVPKIKRVEKRLISKVRRDGATQFLETKVDGNNFIHVTVTVGDDNPVAEGECRSLVGHGSMRIIGDIIPEYQERLSLIMR